MQRITRKCCTGSLLHILTMNFGSTSARDFTNTVNFVLGATPWGQHPLHISAKDVTLLECFPRGHQIQRTGSGVTEVVSHVTFPSPAAPPKLACSHCPKTFPAEQGRALHCKAVHPFPDNHASEWLKRALAAGSTITAPSWLKVQGRCFVAHFYHVTTGIRRSFRRHGTVTFELQPRTQGIPDDIRSDGFGPEHTATKQTRGADRQERYSARQKAAIAAELRELQDQDQEIWRVHGTTPQPFLARKTGIPSSNISKWQLDEETIIKNASDHVVRDFFKRGRPRRWFGDAGKKLYF